MDKLFYSKIAITNVKLYNKYNLENLLHRNFNLNINILILMDIVYSEIFYIK